MTFDQFKLWMEGYMLAKSGSVWSEDDTNTILRNYNFMVLLEDPIRIDAIIPLKNDTITVDQSKPIYSDQVVKMSR